MNIKRSIILLCMLMLIVFTLVSCSGKTDGTQSGADTTGESAVSGGSSTDSGNDQPPPRPSPTADVKYLSADEKTGYIEGEAFQSAPQDGRTKAVTAVAMPGYEFDKWSDGSTDPTRSDDVMPNALQEFTASFKIKALEMPIIMLSTDDGQDITSKDYYVDGRISVLNVKSKYLINDMKMEIRGRGNYTWGSTFNSDPMYNKRPYRIKLSEQVKLCGVGEGKSKNWVLFADHCDQSLLRNNIVYSFAKSLSGISWQPDVKSVEVFLNGEYIGVYLLVEQVQINKNKIALNEDITGDKVAFLVMYSNYANAWSAEGFEVGGHSYEIKCDLSEDDNLFDKQKSYIIDSINECWNAIRSGKQDRIEELIDIDSVIDTYIVHEVFKNLDTGHDNFYMYKDLENDKLHIGPVWDFDQCAGNANEDVDNPENIRGGEKQPWYSYLLKCGWFRKKLVARWNELKPEVDKIPSMITEKAEAAYNSYCRNFDKWQIFGYCINRETVVRRFTTYKEHYEFFAQFMRERTEWFDAYLNDPTFPEGSEMTLEGEGTFDSPYLIKNEKDFMQFTQALIGGNTFEGEYFLQKADVDMSGVKNYRGVGKSCTFAGVYNGDGYVINAVIEGSDGCVFPYLEGTVLNVITTGSVSNSSHAAGIARSVRQGGAVINCMSFMDLYSNENAGGITASNQPNATIVNCYFGGTLEARGTVAPVCVWQRGREGTFENNFYFAELEDHSDKDGVVHEESAVSAEEIGSVMIGRLNAYIDAASEQIDTSFVLRWTVAEDGTPAFER